MNTANNFLKRQNIEKSHLQSTLLIVCNVDLSSASQNFVIYYDYQEFFKCIKNS